MKASTGWFSRRKRAPIRGERTPGNGDVAFHKHRERVELPPERPAPIGEPVRALMGYCADHAEQRARSAR